MTRHRGYVGWWVAAVALTLASWLGGQVGDALQDAQATATSDVAEEDGR